MVSNSISLNFPLQIRLHLIFESLCPDSIRFITNQFTPHYEALAQHMEVIMVPFGKSSVSETAKKPHKHLIKPLFSSNRHSHLRVAVLCVNMDRPSVY